MAPIVLTTFVSGSSRTPKICPYLWQIASRDLLAGICQRYEQLFGVRLDPETNVASTIGAKEGLAHLMWVLVEEGDSVVVPSPAYPIHLVAPRLAGATVLHARIEDGDVLSARSRRRSSPPSPCRAS